MLMSCMVCRQAQWHADKAVRLHSPPVETALLLKVEALLALGKHAEALNEIRSLTVHGDPMATEVLTVRAQALYLSGAYQDWASWHLWMSHRYAKPAVNYWVYAVAAGLAA